MLAYTGVVKENSISLEEIDLKKYNGKKVLVIIDGDNIVDSNNSVDISKYILPETSERAMNVESYMREMRDNDRI